MSQLVNVCFEIYKKEETNVYHSVNVTNQKIPKGLMYICRIFEEQGNEKPCIATVLFVFTSDMGREKKPQKTHVPFKD